jgi:hypothetical protein
MVWIFWKYIRSSNEGTSSGEIRGRTLSSKALPQTKRLEVEARMAVERYIATIYTINTDPVTTPGAAEILSSCGAESRIATA